MKYMVDCCPHLLLCRSYRLISQLNWQRWVIAGMEHVAWANFLSTDKYYYQAESSDPYATPPWEVVTWEDSNGRDATFSITQGCSYCPPPWPSRKFKNEDRNTPKFVGWCVSDDQECFEILVLQYLRYFLCSQQFSGCVSTNFDRAALTKAGLDSPSSVYVQQHNLSRGIKSRK